MAEASTSLVESMGGLKLGAGTSGSDFNRPNPDQIALAESVQRLIQSAEAVATHARQVGPLDIAQISSLGREANALARVTKTFSDATEQYIVAYIISLASPNGLVQNILSHFDDELGRITRDVLNSTSDESNVLREILEMCYDQALWQSSCRQLLHSPPRSQIRTAL